MGQRNPAPPRGPGAQGHRELPAALLGAPRRRWTTENPKGWVLLKPEAVEIEPAKWG